MFISRLTNAKEIMIVHTVCSLLRFSVNITICLEWSVFNRSIVFSYSSFIFSVD